MNNLRPWQEHLPTGTAHDVDLVAGRSLPDVWRSRWAADPGRLVLHSRSTSVSAAELEHRSAAAAGRLAAAGVGAGDRVVVSTPTSIDFVVAYVGLLRLGGVAVPLNSAYREPEVRGIVENARPAAAIVADQRFAGWVERAAHCPTTPPDLSGLPTPSPVIPASALDRVGADAPALLCYTSGTTGMPKGVPLTHGNLLASAEAVRLAWRWTPEDRLILTLPLFHLHGLAVGLHGTLVTGGAVELHDHFDSDAVIDAAGGEGTMFFGVPTMWHRLATHRRVADLAGLRLGVSGSAPLPGALHAAIAEVAGRPPLERYGMTETAMLVSNPYEGERRAGSVGFPLPEVDVRLADDGEIEVRGPNVFAGYWKRPDVNAEAFRDGWFRTGDVGKIDPDGYLHIVGRTKELIISGGYNVYPREVEETLRDHPAVDDAAVVGVPDPEWGERVCAFVVPRADVDDDELVEWCAERLAPYKRPRRWKQVDDLPRNALGKVQRDELTRRLD